MSNNGFFKPLTAAAILGILVVATDLFSATLDGVQGPILVERNGGYAMYSPGMLILPGSRILLLEQATAMIAYADCRRTLRENTIHVVDPGSCNRAKDGFMLAAAVAGSDTAAMTGFVWNDLNGDRIRDPGESARADVTVVLQDGSCQVGVNCPISTSDAAGNFGFTALEPGIYTVGTLTEEDEFVPIGKLQLEAGAAATIGIAATASGFAFAGISGATLVGAATTGTAAATTAGAAGAATTTGATAATTAAVAGGGLAAAAAAIPIPVAGFAAVGAVGAAASSSNNDNRRSISP